MPCRISLPTVEGTALYARARVIFRLYTSTITSSVKKRRGKEFELYTRARIDVHSVSSDTGNRVKKHLLRSDKEPASFESQSAAGVRRGYTGE